MSFGGGRREVWKIPMDIAPPPKSRKTSDGCIQCVLPQGQNLEFKEEALLSEPKSDESGKVLEDDGHLRFEMIGNDPSDRSLFIRSCVKNVVAGKLRAMTGAYIATLVFDQRHRSIIAKYDGEIVGTITFRPFFTPEHNFAEIAFFAVAYDPDAHLPYTRGIGARLMNHLKVEALRKDISRFLTYADNTAIGFFAKQGFSKNIKLDPVFYLDYIKQYTEATLMECVVRKGIDYVCLPEILHAQRQCILNTCMRHEGLTEEWFKGKVGALDIPGVRKDKYSLEDQEKVYRDADFVLKELRKHEDIWPFEERVEQLKKIYPDYEQRVKNPIDVHMIAERVKKRNMYKTFYLFCSDVIRMLRNTIRFNGEVVSEYALFCCRLVRHLGTLCSKVGRSEEFHIVEENSRLPYDASVRNTVFRTIPRPTGKAKRTVSKDTGFYCDVCKNSITGVRYHCDICRYDVCDDCSNLSLYELLGHDVRHSFEKYL